MPSTPGISTSRMTVEKVWRPLGQHRERHSAVARRDHVEALVGEDLLHGLPDVGVVLDQENRLPFGRLGVRSGQARGFR